MTDPSIVERNVHVGKAARAALEMVREIFDDADLTEAEEQRAWGIMLKEVAEPAPKEPSKNPMSYEQARRWYHSRMLEFGKHKGRTIDEVSLTYLVWLDRQPDFRLELRRFLESEFVSSQHYLAEGRAVPESEEDNE